MADTVHFAFLRNGRFTAYCNGSEQAIVTWSSELVTCLKCRLRRMKRAPRGIQLPVECPRCEAVAPPGEELPCGHYRVPGFAHYA